MLLLSTVESLYFLILSTVESKKLSYSDIALRRIPFSINASRTYIPRTRAPLENNMNEIADDSMYIGITTGKNPIPNVLIIIVPITVAERIVIPMRKRNPSANKYPVKYFLLVAVVAIGSCNVLSLIDSGYAYIIPVRDIVYKTPKINNGNITNGVIPNVIDIPNPMIVARKR